MARIGTGVGRNGWRRPAGWAWIATWSWILVSLHRPWSELGGLIGEQMRWFERAVVGSAWMLGYFVGRVGRGLAQSGRGRTHAGLLRQIWIPPAAIVSAALLVLNWQGRWQEILLVTVGFCAYWAGVDVAFGAWPLVCGRHYSWTGPIELDPASPASRRTFRVAPETGIPARPAGVTQRRSGDSATRPRRNEQG